MPLRQDEKEEVRAIVQTEIAKAIKALPKKEAVTILPVVKKQEKSKEIKKNT